MRLLLVALAVKLSTIDRPGGRMWAVFTLLFVSVIAFGFLMRLLIKRLRRA